MASPPSATQIGLGADGDRRHHGSIGRVHANDLRGAIGRHPDRVVGDPKPVGARADLVGGGDLVGRRVDPDKRAVGPIRRPNRVRTNLDVIDLAGMGSDASCSPVCASIRATVPLPPLTQIESKPTATPHGPSGTVKVRTTELVAGSMALTSLPP
jgi:hypothetical protein